MYATNKLLVISLAAVSISLLTAATSSWAQPAGEAKEGDYYSPGGTVVLQPTQHELNQAREGDYYAPAKTIVREPTPQVLEQDHEGDYYAPMKGN